MSEITVSRYMPRRPAEPDQVKRWAEFLRNHRNDIAAMDLFTVPTASFRLLYGFFVIEHGRRHIVHLNATFHPISAWVKQQPREAFPHDTVLRYLIFDRDSIFSKTVVQFVPELHARSRTNPVRAMNLTSLEPNRRGRTSRTVLRVARIYKDDGQGISELGFGRAQERRELG